MEKTKREYFDEIKVAVADNADLVAFIDAEIARIDNRNAKAKAKRAEKTAAGDALRDAIAKLINDADEPVTAEALANALVNKFPEVTKAKVTYRATQLVKAGEIYKVTIKVGEGRKAVAYTATVPETTETETEVEE